MRRYSLDRLALRRATSVLLCLLAMVWLAAAGCGTSGKSAPAEEGLAGTDLDQAQRLFSQLSRAYAQEENRQVLDLAASLLDYYPTFPRNDEAMAMAATAANRTGETGRALGMVDEMQVRYPGSARLDMTLGLAGDWALAAGDTLRGAGYLAAAHDRDPAGHLDAEGLPLGHPVFASLAGDQLDALAQRYPGSSLNPYWTYLRVAARMRADDTSAASPLVAGLQADHPGSAWTAAAADLLAGGVGWRTSRVEVDPDLVGVICPLTGRYAVLGNAFFDAALLAVDAANQEWGRSFALTVEDGAGDPVRAAQAARRLVDQSGAIALLGSLTSGPTAAVAVVADYQDVPLVSPTATNDNIWELGPGVFQTNLTGIYEIRMLAHLAVSVMLKSALATLYPDDAEGRRNAEVFRLEVEAIGGRIVSEEGFPVQGTDFKDAILRTRANRPEVVFVPGSVDQMIMLGPQLDFYRMGSLIMGLSNWNSAKLAERSGTVLERALFPDDLILFPPSWAAEFDAAWNPESYPREATALALKCYQATRMLLDTLGRSAVTSRQDLALALEKRLANRDFEAEGPESFARAMRMFRSEKIVGFPTERFVEGWALTEGARADSLGVEGQPSSAGAVSGPE